MNNKILSVVLVAGIATTGFAAIGSANGTLSGSILVDRSEVREIFEKSRNGETLTSAEQELLDTTKSHFKDKKGKGYKGFGKRKGLKHLTDEEKEALETMTDEEKKTFFDAKKEEMKAKKEANKSMIDALISGETLSAEQEILRSEMLEKIENSDGKFGKRDRAETIEKLLKGETLSSEEQAQLIEMQDKSAEREAQRAIIEPILEKKKNGEELTQDEQNILDEHKVNKPERKHRHR